MTEEKMSLVDHLIELRTRLITTIVLVIICAVGGYIFVDHIIDFLTAPVGKELVFLSPTEAFISRIKVALFSGFLISLPVIFYQGWSYLLPALKDNEKKFLFIILPFSLIFFFGGLAFGFLVVIPFAVRFFLSFASEALIPMFSLHNYLSFVISVLIPFGIIFELPLIVSLLTKLNLISSSFLRKKRKIAIVLVFIFAAILTPPDIISQLLMAGPLILIYEGSILIARIIE
ncbi:MAG: twin-arginine translocase subunit TatC [Halanaerobiales bacterium]